MGVNELLRKHDEAVALLRVLVLRAQGVNAQLRVEWRTDEYGRTRYHYLVDRSS